MRRSSCICDRCGVDMDERVDYPDIDFDDVWCFDVGDVDLCYDCFKKLEQHIKDFIEGGKNGKEENSTN